jgi:hypothetical protein
VVYKSQVAIFEAGENGNRWAPWGLIMPSRGFITSTPGTKRIRDELYLKPCVLNISFFTQRIPGPKAARLFIPKAENLRFGTQT